MIKELLCLFCGSEAFEESDSVGCNCSGAIDYYNKHKTYSLVEKIVFDSDEEMIKYEKDNKEDRPAYEDVQLSGIYLKGKK